MTQDGSRPTIFNIAGNKVGLNVIPQHVAGQAVSATPHRTVLHQESIQGVSPVVRDNRQSARESMEKVL